MPLSVTPHSASAACAVWLIEFRVVWVIRPCSVGRWDYALTHCRFLGWRSGRVRGPEEAKKLNQHYPFLPTSEMNTVGTIHQGVGAYIYCREIPSPVQFDPLGSRVFRIWTYSSRGIIREARNTYVVWHPPRRHILVMLSIGYGACPRYPLQRSLSGQLDC